MACWLIDKANVQVSVKTKSKEAHELINIALSAMQPQRVNKAQGIKITVKYRDNEWHIDDRSEGLSRKLNASGDLIYHLTDRIVFHIANQAKSAHCLHAASVAKNGSAMMIPANSGAGKSTFTTWLASNGFDYITDELILIDADRQLEGIARPIQIKANGIDAIKSLVKKPELIQTGKFANALPLECLGAKVSEQHKHRLALVVFPQYRQGAAYSFCELSSAAAGMRLMANHVNARNLQGHGFREMMAIIRSTQCYSLDYGGFDTLPSDFSRQLESLLNP